ncbi:MAG: hypothetical protein ABSE73_18795, partial [Planctomycetota bacterium]
NKGVAAVPPADDKKAAPPRVPRTPKDEELIYVEPLRSQTKEEVSKKQEAGSKKQETGSKKQEAKSEK